MKTDKKNNKKLIYFVRRAIILLAILLVVLLAIGIFGCRIKTKSADISVKFTSDVIPYAEQSVINYCGIEVTDNIFSILLHKSAIEDGITKNLPYIKSAEISIGLLHKVEISVTGTTLAYSFWDSENGFILFDEDGKVLEKNADWEKASGVPTVYGLAGYSFETGSVISCNKGLISTLKTLVTEYSAADFTGIDVFDLTSYPEIKLEYHSDGVIFDINFGEIEDADLKFKGLAKVLDTETALRSRGVINFLYRDDGSLQITVGNATETTEN